MSRRGDGAHPPEGGLSVSDLAFGYPGHPVGAGVSFGLARGRVAALLGPNGSGKSTLFKTIVGLLAPQHGAVSLDGRRFADLRRDEIARRIGYVPQAEAGYFPYTVFDMVLMGRATHIRPFAAPGRSDREGVHAVLAELGLAHLKDRAYTAVSGGERQLTLIARALVQEPDWLVMDEPTASLDLANRERILSLVAAAASRGLGVVLATHEPSHAARVADDVLLLSGGELAAAGPPDAVLTSEALSAVFRVGVAVRWFPEERVAPRHRALMVVVPDAVVRPPAGQGGVRPVAVLGADENQGV